MVNLQVIFLPAVKKCFGVRASRNHVRVMADTGRVAIPSLRGLNSSNYELTGAGKVFPQSD